MAQLEQIPRQETEHSYDVEAAEKANIYLDEFFAKWAILQAIDRRNRNLRYWRYGREKRIIQRRVANEKVRLLALTFYHHHDRVGPTREVISDD